MSRDEILALFRSEFGGIAERFEVVDIALATQEKIPPAAHHPGVYVFREDEKVIKVGRSLRKRALQHIEDDTGGAMACLRDNAECRLLLYTVRDSGRDLHWTAALEMCFEHQLKPTIASRRQG